MFRTALISMFLTSTALATTWSVDDDGKADFDNIQTAVDAASDGDGAYYGGLIDGHYASRIGLSGFAVDIEDETMAICATDAQSVWGIGGAGGCVDIFELNEDSKFTKVQRILNPEEETGLSFHTVSIGRPFLAVGSWNQGVHIYQRFTSETDPMLCYGDIEWRETQVILPTSEQTLLPYMVSLRDGVLAFSHRGNGSESLVEIYNFVEETGTWEHKQEINMSEAYKGPAGLCSTLKLNEERLLVAWGQANNSTGAKSDVLIFKKGKDGLFALEQDLDFPFWEFPETLEGGECKADIDGDRLVVMDYGEFSSGHEDGPNGIWTYAYNEKLSQWEYEQELVDDLHSDALQWREIAIADDLIFTQSMNELELYNGSFLTTWKAKENGWMPISRTGVPRNHGGNLIFFPSKTIAASTHRCITTNMIGLNCYSDTTLINMDADNDGVLDVDQILLDPEIDSDNSGVPDKVEPDCNNNGIADSIDIYFDHSLDSNGSENGIIDSCEQDSDGDGIPDWAECDFIDYNFNDIDDWFEGDCDNDGTPNVLEIWIGWEEDVNGDWIPDICQCFPDISQNSEVDVTDLLIIIDFWGDSCNTADINFDGIVDVSDLLIVIGNWGPCE